MLIMLKSILNIFETICHCVLIDKIKKIVTHLKQSGKVALLEKTVIQDIETRWNSKCMMLKSVYEQYDKIDELYSESNMEFDLDKLLLKNLIAVLEPFLDATSDLERDKEPTIQKVVLWYYKLLKFTAEITSEDSSNIRKLKAKLNSILLAKFKIMPIHKIATFLTPTFRQLKMLPNIERENTHIEIKNWIQDKFYSLQIINTSHDEVEVSLPSKKSKFSEWEDDRIETTLNDTLSSQAQKEIDNYLKNGKPNDQDNILMWWRKNEKTFPGLALLAKSVLATPATSASSERAFSIGGRIFEERRTNLNPLILDQVLFLNSNLN